MNFFIITQKKETCAINLVFDCYFFANACSRASDSIKIFKRVQKFCFLGSKIKVMCPERVKNNESTTI
ncbi:MAG: hypothetical protein EAZ67_01575 [Cytophagales bacterium]|nr:MAG: hypothetical protein EAZ67_01575 [Cytophagales bacterium]